MAAGRTAPLRWGLAALGSARGGLRALARGGDRGRRAVFTFALAWIGGGAILVRPSAYGDGAEYQLMAESLLRHASADVRADDVRALAVRARGFDPPLNLPAAFDGYYPGRDGRYYCYHFWGYPLLTLPLRALLHRARAGDLRSAQLTNALALLLALHQALWGTGLPRRAALALALLALFSPAAWLVLWTHPEAVCFALVLLGLIWTHAGRRTAAVACVAVATAQNPPLAWLLVPLWARACLRPGQRRPALGPVLRATAAALPAALSPLFYLWQFGTPSLIARESMDFDLVSPRRALDLLFDLNLGLVAYAPLSVVLFLLALALALRRAREAAAAWGRAAVLFLVATSCTVNSNWNHGSAGPSRYAVWIAPLVLFGAAQGYARVLEHHGPAARRAWTTLVALAVVSQAALVFARGGLVQPPDSSAHSWAARLVLHAAPGWYSPAPEVFVERTLGRPLLGRLEPAIYADGSGCRKAWVRSKDAPLLRRRCGRLPPGEEAFFARTTRRRQWRYVDY